MENILKVAGLTLALFCMSAAAEDQPTNKHVTGSAMQGQEAHDFDNTGINKRDREGMNPTEQDQKNPDGDRNLLAAVRQTIVDDDSLSITAHNVKIIVQNGVVTLRGPVNTAAEKAKVESLAQAVAGVSSIDNQLDIKTP
ncbi:MAG TPA: BON domain-containing protein [Dongiaceae bacterium]|nr:BON domain-containing protein [Dongiaceae bacterium]